ncbi:HPr family phosphocarrier protein [bacterium]|nr:HPr family phosphocarrier protein [bacterium]
MEETIVKKFTISNELGLHARAAASFVKVANRFRSKVNVKKDNVSVNGKSIMGVLMLAASKGTEIEISASGPDANILMKEIEKLISNNFGE